MAKPITFIEASSTGSTGSIKIVDRISEYTQSSSVSIKTIVEDFLKTGVTEVEVYMNSAGGSCFEATEMCNDLKRLSKVKLKIGAVAASAATYFMTQFESEAYPNSQIMIHRPKLGTYGDIIGIKADLRLLENTTDDYKKAYATKMGKTEDEIESFFAQGDYWMTANEAKALGLLDVILGQTEEVTAESIKILEAVAAPIIPEIKKTNQIEQMERKQLLSRLKLSADATDAEIETALETLEAKASRTETLEANAKAQKEALAEALVSGAILSKKITADQKDNYMKLANADFDGTKAIIDGMQGVVKASTELEAHANGASRENWTLEDYQTKDPNALLELMQKDPEKFKKLEAAYFG